MSRFCETKEAAVQVIGSFASCRVGRDRLFPASTLHRRRDMDGESNVRLNIQPRVESIETSNFPRTHERGPAWPVLMPEQQLRRSVMSCLLWEKQFYEDGESIADRIVATAEQCQPSVVAAVAREARKTHNLRHAPLLLLEVLTRTGKGSRLVSDTIADVIQRADELGEFMAVYRGNKRHPLSAQAKKGLARAIAKFDAYQLAKYNRAGSYRLRDVLFMTHPTPVDEEQSEVWAKLASNALESPDTWEVVLSAGANKRETFERLLRERKLGYFALLRNLRNMAEAQVDQELVRAAIVARKGGAERILPFRFVAAARAAPVFAPALDKALAATIADAPQLRDATVVLVDVSASMDDRLSANSDLTRMDAAAALGALVNAEHLRVFTFSHQIVEVHAERGLSGIKAILQSQPHGGTFLGGALDAIRSVPKDRLIVITDEQAHDDALDPACDNAYLINVASYKNGVGYGRWTHLDGFSEAVLKWIAEYEREPAGTA